MLRTYLCIGICREPRVAGWAGATTTFSLRTTVKAESRGAAEADARAKFANFLKGGEVLSCHATNADRDPANTPIGD